MKKKTSISVEKEALDKAKEMGLNLSSLIEHVIESAVDIKRCPTCGQKIKGKRCTKKG